MIITYILQCKISFLLRGLRDVNLKDDKYVKELQNRIDVGKKEPSEEESSKEEPSAERETEPATTISWEKFFMRMAKLSQKRPGDFQYEGVSHSLIHNYVQVQLYIKLTLKSIKIVATIRSSAIISCIAIRFIKVLFHYRQEYV